MKSKKIKKQQLLPGIFISLAISFILFIYAPVELYCSNLDEFWFDFGVLMRLALSMFAVSMILMTLGYVILLLIHPVVYRLGLAAGLLLLVCTYVQGNFLITNLPPLDGTNINWKLLIPENLRNCFQSIRNIGRLLRILHILKI
mgnify:CR=1 FL=1